MKVSLAKLAAAAGLLTLPLSAGAGIASADPTDALVNSTCTYSQVVSALNATQPALAQQFAETPAAQAFLRSFIASSPAQRAATVRQAQASPAYPQLIGPFVQVASSCANY